MYFRNINSLTVATMATRSAKASPIDPSVGILTLLPKLAFHESHYLGASEKKGLPRGVATNVISDHSPIRVAVNGRGAKNPVHFLDYSRLKITWDGSKSRLLLSIPGNGQKAIS